MKDYEDNFLLIIKDIPLLTHLDINDKITYICYTREHYLKSRKIPLLH